MKDPEANELLSDILDGHASVEDKARLLAWIRENGGERGEVAQQLVLDGLLGVALEENGGDKFQQQLQERLAIEQKRNYSRRFSVALRNSTRRVALVLGPVLAALAWWGTHSLLNLPAGADPLPACWTAAILALCATWWVLEPIPVGATALIPLAVFPLLGVMDERQVADSYCHHLVILFLSGFILSKAMEQRGTHRRVVLGMVRMIGGSGGRRLVLGFMVAAGGISMWTSNTVTVLMLLPAALAVIDQSRGRRLATPLLLGIAYAAAIGGMGTPVGTPPNGIFMAEVDALAAQGVLSKSFGFIDWMKVAVPVVVIMIPLAWWWLTRGEWPSSPIRLAPAGPWTRAEARVSIILALTAILWMTRADPLGGWSGLLGMPAVKDSSVGLLAVIALFLIPSGEGKGRALIDWQHAFDVPWGILILLGGGIAIGNAFATTGLSQAIAGNLQLLSGLPMLPLILIVALTVSFLTEFSSNTATATVLMPLMAATAVAADLPPIFLMLSASLANSCSFMLPIGTPPAAIVFAVGDFSIRQMLWEGLVLKLMSVIVITLVCYVMLG